MIEFCNGKYQTAKDKYQWVLTEFYEGKDKDGNPKQHSRETYHAKLEQVCREVIDREAGYCGSAQEIIELLKSAESTLYNHLTGDKK